MLTLQSKQALKACLKAEMVCNSMLFLANIASTHRTFSDFVSFITQNSVLLEFCVRPTWFP